MLVPLYSLRYDFAVAFSSLMFLYSAINLIFTNNKIRNL